jgi:hypothetical protein
LAKLAASVTGIILSYHIDGFVFLFEPLHRPMALSAKINHGCIFYFFSFFFFLFRIFNYWFMYDSLNTSSFPVVLETQ